jgi:hypothetical protein
VVAGTPNAGKTAFLLNFVRYNMGSHTINYFISEMGGSEFNIRISNFKYMQKKDWNFNPRVRSSDFHDVIRPDEINIIDFLEVHEDFWKVGLFIKQIYDKLNKGIAIIAIQKNKGTDQGLGGMRGMEKARLYLAMEETKIKIVKAKNWTSQINTNGLIKRFHLEGGWEFTENTEWIKDDEDYRRR